MALPLVQDVPFARDYYLTAQQECSSNTGVCPDTQYRGNSSDNDVTFISGMYVARNAWEGGGERDGTVK